MILNYQNWKSLNEGLFWDVKEKEFDANGVKHKVKVKYIDGNSFKVKAVNDRDMVNADGTIDASLMDGIVNFLKGHDATDFAREYPALQALASFYKDNFFTFNVKKEDDRRQVVVFTIQKRANFKGVGPEIKAISDDKAAGMTQAPDAKSLLAASDKSLSQNTAAKPEDKGAAKPASIIIDKPLTFDQIKNLKSDVPGFKAIKTAYFQLVKDPTLTANPIFPKLKAELKSGTLGDNAVLFAKGIIAGFGIKDEYGDPAEEINQEVVNKILALAPATTAQNSSHNYYLGLDGLAIFEADDMVKSGEKTASNLLAAANKKPEEVATLKGFDTAEFIKAVGGATTGDIKIPDGGFKKGSVAKKDPEFMKFQDLVIKTFSKKLANNPTYTKFASYGLDGDYGLTSEKMVAGLKIGFGLKDLDGKTVTAELIDAIIKNKDKINESVYFNLKNRLVEQFDIAGFEEVTTNYNPNKTATPTASGEAAPEENKTKTDVKSDFTSQANEVINLLNGASNSIVALYKNTEFFMEYKGAVDDDEDGAVKDIFGDTSSDTSSWWYQNIWIKYLKPAGEKIAEIKKGDANLESRLMKEWNKLSTVAYNTLKAKTLGTDSVDEYTWSILGLDGTKKAYSVDTDF